MKFLFSVIKIYSLLNFIFAITEDGKYIEQLFNTRQWHPSVTITQLQAAWVSLICLRSGPVWSRRFVSKELSYF